MGDLDKNSKEYKIGYTMGQILGKTCVGCTIAVVIAVTVRFILWLF